MSREIDRFEVMWADGSRDVYTKAAGATVRFVQPLLVETYANGATSVLNLANALRWTYWYEDEKHG